MSEINPIVIESPGERMVFMVRSDTDPKKAYRVDLLANDGAGWCECKNFEMEKQKAIDDGYQILTSATCCKHHSRACWHFLRTFLPELAKTTERPPRQ